MTTQLSNVNKNGWKAAEKILKNIPKNVTCLCGRMVSKIYSSTLILTCLWTSKRVLTKPLDVTCKQSLKPCSRVSKISETGRGGAPTPQRFAVTYCLGNFVPKIAWMKKELWPGGTSLAPPVSEPPLRTVSPFFCQRSLRFWPTTSPLTQH